MSKREQLCLQMRNKNGLYEETYCKHYIKNKWGYLRFLFFRFQSISVFILGAISAVVSWHELKSQEASLLKYIPLLIAAILGFAWIFMIIKGLWYWKYTKHVFVSNEGIWVMSCSTLW